ncbi:aminotransferase A [Siminovitchia acidinfaciens]|uniref:Aminotransferase n=1 Tax=Siminovitchia acidinfaciens TaxID=2321395 RepID=A0A429XT63_9BACI|nr:aminotransferase A [Siminovitchia acidinfaciens]RST70878.1 aminotransferase A [Siminovitchia acidinfaciens]
MEHLLNEKIKNIEIPTLRKFFNMLADYPEVVNLTVGLPDFLTPAHIKEAGKEAIDKNMTTYSNHAGMLELRQAASQFGKVKYGLDYDPKNEVVITNGASEALDISFRTILKEGSEVLLPAPVYPGYEALITMSGGVPVFMDTTPYDFKVTPELIEKHLTDKTRCLVLTNPSNPTGVLLDENELADIAALLKDKDIFVISDEIYSELTYDKQFTSFAVLPGMREKTIVINGLSKSHAMTGWRIGFTYAPAYLTEHMLKVHYFNTVCTSTISQYAAIRALTKGIDDAIEMRNEYEKRKDYTYKRLNDMGLETVYPEGAFYIFPSIKDLNMKSFDFAKRMIEEAQVGVVPGSAFSPIGEGYVRISYAYSMEHLEQGLDRMEKFIKKIKG